MQVGQCGNQVGKKKKVVVYVENGIGGGGGEYCGDSGAHVDLINVLYHEASEGKYLPRAVLFDIEPGVISAVTLSRRMRRRRRNC
jgi:tubulin beta